VRPSPGLFLSPCRSVPAPGSGWEDVVGPPPVCNVRSRWRDVAEDTGDAENQSGYPMSSVLRTTVLFAALTALFLVIGGP
jgi:hypothetical protein